MELSLQNIKELKERASRLSILGNVYQEKCITFEKQLSCLNSDKFELKCKFLFLTFSLSNLSLNCSLLVLLAERENEIHELRSKLARYTSNISSKPFNNPTGNGFPLGSPDFEQQIVNNRELVNRCFSSCSPGNGSTQATRALSPSVFSSPTPPMSILGPISASNISPGSGSSSKLGSASSGFHHHLNSTESEEFMRSTFRLSREAQIWPQSSSTPTGPSNGGVGPVSGTVPSGSTILRPCDSSNLGAVGSERESANGRHSSQSNCSINNRINGPASGSTLNNGFSTSASVLAPSTSSSSSPLGVPSGNGLPTGANPLSAQATGVNRSKAYDDYFGEDAVFDIPSVSNNSQSFF